VSLHVLHIYLHIRAHLPELITGIMRKDMCSHIFWMLLLQAVEQLAFADIVLLNKVDLVDAQEKAAVIKRIKVCAGLV
jgi:G3E family GTPase